MTEKFVNGVDTQTLSDLAALLAKEPSQAELRMRVDNKWMTGAYSQTNVESFFAMGKEMPHQTKFLLEADEPKLLAGTDRAPSPSEVMLHSLGACVTVALVYHASMHGIRIESVESVLDGDIDARGFMGIDKDVRKGFSKIRVTMRVKSDGGTPEELEAYARYSPTYDVVARGTDVELKVEKA